MKPNSLSELPSGYGESFRIDLQKDKKTALVVNGIGLFLLAALCALGHRLVPVSVLFDLEAGYPLYFGRLAALLIGLVLYMVLHELVHGICMKRFGAPKIKYGFTGLYAYAGSDWYFYRRPYIIIALAPVVVWGIVLLVLNCVVGAAWFWVVYVIQVCNLSGAAGDLYVTVRLCRMPEDILIRDTGLSMTVYARN